MSQERSNQEMGYIGNLQELVGVVGGRLELLDPPLELIDGLLLLFKLTVESRLLIVVTPAARRQRLAHVLGHVPLLSRLEPVAHGRMATAYNGRTYN